MEIKMNEIICSACNNIIYLNKDEFEHLESWKGKDMKMESWWHKKCFKKAMNRDLTQLEKTAQIMLQKAGSIFNNLPQELTQEKFEIK